MNRTVRLALPLALLLFLQGGCVYYNTFYLARRYYRDAELARLGKSPSGQPTAARTEDLYGKALEYAAKVLAEHPDSKWVPEALLISQKALYYRGDVAASIRKGHELGESFPDHPLIPESRVWLARGMIGLGDHLAAASQAHRAVTSPDPVIRTEARLVEAQALGLAGRLEEAETVLDRLLEDPQTPPEMALEARLEVVRVLEAQGDHSAAADRLAAVLEDATLPLSTRTDLTADLVDQLLLAGLADEAQSRLGELERLDDIGFYKGVIRYYQGRLALARGANRQVTENMVFALGDGVTAEWEYRIRMDLANFLESTGNWVAALPEFRVITTGAVAPEQKAQAQLRLDAIVRLYALRSLVAVAEEGITFPDPRNQAQPARPGAHPTPTVVENRRPPPDDPDLVDMPRRAGAEETATVTDARAGDVPPGMYLFLLAEQFTTGLARPDSARRYLELLVARHPDSELAPRALFAISDWAPTGSTGEEQRAQARRRLQEHYLESRWTWLLLRQSGEEVPEPPELQAEAALHRAEGLADPLAEPARWAPAVDSLRAVALAWPETEAARRAEFAAARMLELGAGPVDSARVAYERVMTRYPGSEQARRAAERLPVESGVRIPPDPVAVRRQALEQEMASWNTWFQTLAAARVVRIQPGQRRIAGQPVQPGQAGTPPDEDRPRRPPPTTSTVIPPRL